MTSPFSQCNCVIPSPAAIIAIARQLKLSEYMLSLRFLYVMNIL
jgi:hypothetical protein